MKEQKIVVPWDFSRHSKSALKFAYQQYAADNIYVICVLDRPNPYEPGHDWGEEGEEKARKGCEEDFAADAPYAKHAGIHFKAVFGDPATEIIHFANQQHASFIVLSTHGRTGLKRLLMGSVAQNVARKSTCPIILLSNQWYVQNAEEPPKAV